MFYEFPLMGLQSLYVICVDWEAEMAATTAHFLAYKPKPIIKKKKTSSQKLMIIK